MSRPKVQRIICLANSRKRSGRCVAGKEQTGNGPGKWIRPVSDRSSQEVSERERQYKDGSDPQILDIIDVPLLDYHPASYQTENWVLDAKFYWVRVGQIKWRDLCPLADNPPKLWINGSSTKSGLNDRVSLPDSKGLDCSLYLLYINRMKLQVFAPGADFGNPKRRVQAEFSYNGVGYSLWVTDPVIERQYLAREDGEYEIGECFVTVSLGEAHEGYCYKLVATVITQSRADQSS